MLLVDWQIKELLYNGLVKWKQPPYHLVNPSSMDFTLGARALLMDRRGDMTDPFGNKFRELTLTSTSHMFPAERMLLETEQYFIFPENISGLIRLKSSLGRAFYEHLEAGWVDAGYSGRLTLELVNHADVPLPIQPGMKIGQIIFFQHTFPKEPYQGRYKGDLSVELSKGIM